VGPLRDSLKFIWEGIDIEGAVENKRRILPITLTFVCEWPLI
jgi:hypothetical protein